MRCGVRRGSCSGWRWPMWPSSPCRPSPTVPRRPSGPNVERFARLRDRQPIVMIGLSETASRMVIGLVAVAGVLEASQGLVDGRHGRLHDFVIKVPAAAAGCVAALVDRQASPSVDQHSPLIPVALPSPRREGGWRQSDRSHFAMLPSSSARFGAAAVAADPGWHPRRLPRRTRPPRRRRRWSSWTTTSPGRAGPTCRPSCR